MPNIYAPVIETRYNFINESICKNKDGIMRVDNNKIFIPEYTLNKIRKVVCYESESRNFNRIF